MMSPWLKAIQLAIQHMRDRGQRVPVSRMNMSECPSDPGKCQSSGDLRVLVDVVPVIVADELVVNDPVEGEPDNCRQDNADNSAGEAFSMNARAGKRDCACQCSPL